MLSITVTEGNEVYVGDACVIQVGEIDGEGTTRVLVWDRGRFSRHTLVAGWPVPVTESLTLGVAKYSPSFHNVKLGFEAPREVPIMRKALLKPARRREIEGRARGKQVVGAPTGPRAATASPA